MKRFIFGSAAVAMLFLGADAYAVRRLPPGSTTPGTAGQQAKNAQNQPPKITVTHPDPAGHGTIKSDPKASAPSGSLVPPAGTPGRVLPQINNGKTALATNLANQKGLFGNRPGEISKFRINDEATSSVDADALKKARDLLNGTNGLSPTGPPPGPKTPFEKLGREIAGRQGALRDGVNKNLEEFGLSSGGAPKGSDVDAVNQQFGRKPGGTDWSDASPALKDNVSGLLTGSNRSNPYAANFEAAWTPPRSTYLLGDADGNHVQKHGRPLKFDDDGKIDDGEGRKLVDSGTKKGGKTFEEWEKKLPNNLKENVKIVWKQDGTKAVLKSVQKDPKVNPGPENATDPNIHVQADPAGATPISVEPARSHNSLIIPAEGRHEFDVERLIQGVTTNILSKVNPNPNAQPRQSGGGGIIRPKFTGDPAEHKGHSGGLIKGGPKPGPTVGGPRMIMAAGSADAPATGLQSVLDLGAGSANNANASRR